MAHSIYLLLLTRFCFGAGEAGAFPNIGVCVSRWFPLIERARTMGVVLMCMQIGGAIAPLVILPIQVRYGWRASFYVLGALGVIWCLAWYWWYRDTPAEKASVRRAEIEGIRVRSYADNHHLPGMSRCAAPIYGRSCSKSSVTFTRSIILSASKLATLFFLGLVYAGITLQQTVVAAVILDISRKYIGGICGVVNMVGSFGGFVFSVSFGYFVTWFGSYDLALIPVAVMLTISALAWLRVDATEELIPAPPPEAVPDAPVPVLS